MNKAICDELMVNIIATPELTEHRQSQQQGNSLHQAFGALRVDRVENRKVADKMKHVSSWVLEQRLSM